MLRDDGNGMANVRDHKAKVKRRDKLGKVSDVLRRRLENGTLKTKERGGNEENKRK